MKGGVYTTEFWLTVGGGLIAAVALLTQMTAEQAADAQAALARAVPAVIALAGFATTAWAYVRGRTELKVTDREVERDAAEGPPEGVQ